MQKSLSTLILLLLFVLPIKSQEVSNTVFLFPEYHKGKVYFKNHAVIDGVLNYETITQQMLFKQNDNILSLGLPETTDSIVISGFVFVHYQKKEFFRKVLLEKGAIYLQYKSKKFSSAHEVGFGGFSEVSNARSISNVTSLNGGLSFSPSQLTSREQFKSTTDSLFWIKKSNEFFPVNSIKQVRKVFPRNIN